MPIEKWFESSRVVELASHTRDDAFFELIDAIGNSLPSLDRESVYQAVCEREKLTSTRIGSSIAIPHARIEGLSTPIVAVGRSLAGVSYDKHSTDRVHIIVMILSDESQHLKTLSSVVGRLASAGIRERLVHADSTDAIYRILSEGPSGRRETGSEEEPISAALLDGAVSIARSSGAKSLFIHTDHVTRQIVKISRDFAVYVFSAQPLAHQIEHIRYVHFPFPAIGIESKIELSLIFARISEHLPSGVRVVSVIASGIGGHFDRIALSDSTGRFGTMLEGVIGGVGAIDQHVFARVLQLALTLALEGREGSPVGTIFVVGDTERVLEQCQQLIANPFKGYQDAEKNVLDPSMEESIKEYARIDGAFIVQSNGVIVSAGTYLAASNVSVTLPRGLGSRHVAAASITATTDALSIALSESTRTLSIFRGGKRIAELTSPAV